MFNVVDEFSRECELQLGEFSIGGSRVAGELTRLSAPRPLPSILVWDNGPGFTSKVMFFWSRGTRVKLHFILPALNAR